MERYWDLSATCGDGRPLGAYEEELIALLEDAVRLRLISDVPLGAFLSGGLDSSVIAALMQRSGSRWTETFSIGFEGEADESAAAWAAAQALGTRHHLRRVSALDLEALPTALWHLDEPIADPAILPTFALARFAKRRVTVALTGEGADELFGGYAKYRHDAWVRLYRRLPEGMRRRFLDRLLPRLVSGGHNNHRLFLLDDATRRRAWDEVALPRQKAAFYGPALSDALRNPEGRTTPLTREARDLDAVTAMLLADVKTSLADDLLMKVDKMTMAHALEARTPYLDYRVVEFAFRVPARLKLSLLGNKRLLRRIARRWLPAAITARPKQGFSVPIAAWFRGEAGEQLATLLRAATHDWIKPEGVRALLGEHRRGIADRSRQLWAVLCFELWHRLMIDGTPPHPLSD